MNLRGKQVTVIGLGNSGVNAAIFLNDIGAVVMATDSQDTPLTRKAKKALESKGAKVEIGGHTERFIKGSEVVVVSPGVENASAAMKWADKFKIPVISEMELGYFFCRGRIIAITGTNGKSTVTALIGEILKGGGKDTVVCGNIGNSLCGELNRINKDTLVVLEVSSFQLERIDKFKPHIAIILNITDDHMDRYDRFDDYFKEKLKIFRNQDDGDILILNHDALILRPLKEMARSKVLFYSRVKEDGNSFLGNTRLKGLHNTENILVSHMVGKICGVSEESMKNTISNFRGLPHRFETAAVIDGVEYIDDSKGTTVDSTKRALESCERPVILIAGGKDKFSNYSVVSNIVKKKVKRLVLIGEAKGRIRAALESSASISEAEDMPDAVKIAQRFSVKGDIVLLSPMCSSFDMFIDYKTRGEVFKKAVNGLARPTHTIKA